MTDFIRSPLTQQSQDYVTAICDAAEKYLTCDASRGNPQVVEHCVSVTLELCATGAKASGMSKAEFLELAALIFDHEHAKVVAQ